MQDRGTDQRVAAAVESNRIVRRLVRRLSRRESAALTLPLTLALLGTSVARERSENDELSQDEGRADGQGLATVAKAGDKLAIYSHDAVFAQHLLTDAEVAAGEVRLALRMVRGADGAMTLQSASADAVANDASGTADPEAAHLAAGSEEASAGGADSEAAAEASANADGSSGENVDTGAAAAPAAEEEDDDDRGLLWIVVGLGAAGAGIALANGGSDSKASDPPVVVNPPVDPTPVDPTPVDPTPSGLSGQVVKGYVQGAAVYLDTNHDGLPDGDPVYTDAEGRFTFESAPDGASFIVYGGVDTLTHVPLDGMILRAPAGATVVTPLTTLIDEMMRLDSSLTATEAQAKLLSALGLTLPEGADLLTFDSVALIASGGASIEDASEVVLNTISSIQSLLTASGALGALDAAGAGISALAQTLLNSAGAVDLTSAADVQLVLEAAFDANGVGASNADDLGNLAAAVAAVNGALVEASGLGETALQATRYALSGFQDLLTKVGANAQSSEQYTHDISFYMNDDLYKAVNKLAGGSVDTIIGENTEASISYLQRLEGQRFVFALNPELKLYQGAPDRIDVVTVKFDLQSVVVQRESRGADGQIVTEVLTADEDGRYTLQYDELDKIYIQPPENFNGMLGADVTAHYVGLDIIDTPDTLGIEITAVNDAPTSANATVTGIEDEEYVFSLTDFPFSDPTDAAYAGGPNALAAIRVGSLPAEGALFLDGVELTDGDIEAGLWVSAAEIAQGLLSYVAPANANGPGYAQFGFQVRDDGGTAHGGKAISAGSFVMTLDLTAVDDAPVAQAAAGVVLEDNKYVFTGREFGYTDVEGHELAALVIRSVPGNGVLYFGQHEIALEDIDGNGYVIPFSEIEKGKLEFRPTREFSGTESFTFALQDVGGAGPEGANTSAPVEFTFTVTPVNDAPVAGDKSVSVEENGTHVFSVDDFGFTDIDGNNLANIIIGSLPGGGTLYFGEDALGVEDIGLTGYVVSVEDIESGKLVFVPESGFSGVLSFEYSVQDDGGTESDGRDLSRSPATLTIQVGNVNDPPVPSVSSAALDEDGEYVFSASDFAFLDIEDNELAAMIIRSLPGSGTLYFDGEPVTLDMLGESGFEVSAADLANSLLRFEPAANANGTVSFDYQLRDEGGTASGGNDTSELATFTLNVTSVSDAPVASDASVAMDEDGSHIFSATDFSFTDVDGDSLANIIITSLPTGGRLYFGEDRLRGEDLGADGYVVSLEDLQNGLLTFVPDADFNGVAELEYRVQDTGSDGGNLSEPATISFTVNAVNDAPMVPQDSSATLNEDGEHVFSASDFPFSDCEDHDLAAVIIRSLPAQGTLYFDGEPVTLDMLGENGFEVTAAGLANSLLRFEPAADANGAVSFNYQVRDEGGTGNGGSDTSEQGTFTLNVTPVSDAPEASGGSLSLNENESHTFAIADFGFSDIDGDAFAMVFLTSLPANGTLFYDGQELQSDDLGEDGFGVSAEDLQNGLLSFVPGAGFNGVAEIEYRVQDAGADGANLSEPATLSFTVNAVNDAPVPLESSATLDEDTTHVFALSDFQFEDAEQDSLAAVLFWTLPAGGTLYFDGEPISYGMFNDDGVFEVTAEDIAGSLLTFVPSENLNGPITFQYRLRDAGGTEHGGNDTSETSTFTLNVTPVSDAPVANPSPQSLEEDQELPFTFVVSTFGLEDADEDTLAKVFITSLPENGTLYFDGNPVGGEDLGEDGFTVTRENLQNGMLQFVPDGDFNGDVQIQYRVQDSGANGANLSEIATMTFTVNPVADAPLAGEDSVTMQEDGMHVFSLDEFDFHDADGDSLESLIITSLPTNGSLYLNDVRLRGEDMGEDGIVVSLEDLTSGRFHFVAEGDFNGTVYFDYRLKDDSGVEGSDTSLPATFALHVESVSDAPVASDSTVNAKEDKSRTLCADDFLFTDGDGDALAAIIIHSLPENGALRFDGVPIDADDITEGFRVTAEDLEQGKLVFVPPDNYFGSVSFTFQVQDASEDSEADTSGIVTMTIDVRSMNDAPLLSLPEYPTGFSPEHLGESNRVNTYTSGNQEDPSIAALADGGYVIVWISKDQDGGGYGIFGQRYSADGEKSGEEFQINTTTVNDQFHPQVTAGPGEGFTVIWSTATEQSGKNITASEVVIREFPAGGEAWPELPPMMVVQTGLQIEPVLARSEDRVLAVWTADGANGFDIRGWLNPSGEGGPKEFTINTTTAFDQSEPAVITLADGTFVVSWTGIDGEDDSKGVFAQRIDVDGEKLGEEFRVNGSTEGDQSQPTMAALADGGFVVAWTGIDSSLKGVYVQRYDDCGEPAGKPVLVNTNETNDQRDPAVAALPDGGFVVTWTSWGTTDSTLDIFVQRFGSDGTHLGDPVLVNTVTVHEQTTPAISVLADGSFVVTWQSNNEDGSGYGIYAQQFAPFAPVFIEGGEPVVIAPTAQVSDVELGALNEGLGDWTGASIVIQRDGGKHHHGHGWKSSPDQYGFENGDGYELREDGTIVKDGEGIAHFSVEKGKLVISFATYEGATVPTTAMVNHVLQHITYWNTSDDPGESVTLKYRVNDGNEKWGGEQGFGEGKTYGTVTVQIIPINDAPEPRDNTVRMLEDESHTFEARDFRFRDAEDDDLETVIITSLPDNGTLYFGEDALTGEDLGEDGFVVSAWDLACGKLFFEPNENFNGTVSFGYRVQDDGGTARNGEDTSGEATMSLVVKAVNDAPEIVMSSARTLIVDTAEDVEDDTDGVLSLREALAQAQEGDVIRFHENLSGVPILVASTLQISTNVYIDGSTVPELQLSYQGDDTLFRIEEGAEVVISGVSLFGGGILHDASGFEGAAIWNSGTLTLHDLTISGFNRAIGGEIGAAVLVNDLAATVYMSQVTISDNTAFGGTEILYGTSVSLVFNEGDLRTDRVEFSQNFLQGGDAGYGGSAYLIWSTSPGVGDVTFAGNTVEEGLGEVSGVASDAFGYEPGEAGFELQLPQGGDSVQYKEGEDAVLLAPGAQVSDIELDAMNSGLGDWSGASITIGRKTDGEDHHGSGWGHGGWGHSKSADEYGFVDGNGLTFVEGQIVKTVDLETSVIGHYSTSKWGRLTITFSTEDGEGSAIPTTADVNHVLQQVTYRNTSDDPEESITLTFRVEDGNARWHGEQGRGGELKATGELVVNITPVNDAPEPRDNKVRMLEDESHTFEARNFRFRDAEDDDLEAVIITSLPDNGTLYFGENALTLEDLGDGGFVVSAADLACGKLVFQPDENFNGSVSFGYRVQDEGGTQNGGVDLSDEATIQINVRSVNDAPEISFEAPAGEGPMDYFDRYVDGDGAIEGLSNLRNLTVSPDGKNLYAVAGEDSLVVFMRNEDTGQLSYMSRIVNWEGGIDSLEDPSDLALSDDGRFLYVVSASSNTLTVFSRDEGTGELSLAGYLMDGESEVDGLSAARGITISPDGKHIYVASPGDGAVAVFARDADIGSPTFLQKLEDGEDGMYGFGGAADVAVSPEGDLVYVVGGESNALAIFTRDSSSGLLTFSSAIVDDTGGQDGLANATSIAVSADGLHVYVTGSEDNSIAVFVRLGNALISVTVIQDGLNGVDGLAGVNNIVLSPDGLTVYATGSDDNAVAMFSRDPETGLLTFQRTFVDGLDFVGLEGANALAVSPDGRNVYIGSGDAATIAVLAPQSVGGDVEPVTYVENGEPVLLSSYATVSDVELDARNEGQGDWSGASVTLVRKGDGEGYGHGHHHNIQGNSDDHFDFVAGNGLTFVEGEILKTVDTVTSVIGYYELDDGKLVISFGAEGDGSEIPTSEDVNNVLRQVTYSNVSDNPDTSVTLTYRVNDGNSRWHGDQGKGTGRVVGEITVDITPVNDAPVVEEPPIVTLNEDQSYTFSTSDFEFSDPENDGLAAVIIQSVPSHGTLYFNGEPVTEDQVSCGFSVSAADLSCGRLTFEPDEHYFGSTTFQFQVRDSGGTANHGEDTSGTTTFTFNLRSVNDAPELDIPVSSGFTFTVTTLDDIVDEQDGQLSLREALAAANDGDSITFDGALMGGEILLTDTLTIDKQVYINGRLGEGTDPSVALKGNGFTAVYVSDSVGSDLGGAVLEGIAINGIEAVTGAPGGLINVGYLTLAHVEIAHMSSVGIGDGYVVGALWNTGGATLKAYDLKVHGVTVAGGPNDYGDNAYAVLNSGSFDAVDVVIGGNTVTGGASYALETDGGGAYDFGNTSVLIGAITFLDGDEASTLTGGEAYGVEGNTGTAQSFVGHDSQGPSELVYVSPVSAGKDATVDYSAGGDAVLLSSLASVADVELDKLNSGEGNWSGATITLQRQGGANADDVFGYEAPQGFVPPALVWNAENGTILKDEQVIATFTNGAGVLSIHFTGYGSAIPTTNDVNEILQKLTYRNSSMDPEEQVTVEYTVADGNLSFKGTQGSGGEGVTIGSVIVNIAPLELDTPVVTLAAETDTASLGDGITSSTAPQLLVQLPCNAYVGSVLELYANGEDEPFATRTLTEEDLTAGSVAFDAPEGEKVAISAQLVGANGNGASGLSPAFFLVSDSSAPEAPVLDEESQIVRADHAGTSVITGSAEAFSTVTVELSSSVSETPIVYSVTADGNGRFSVVVDATELVSDSVKTVSIAVSATDRAGNTSSTAAAAITVTAATPPAVSTTGGSGIDDVWAPTVTPQQGVYQAVTFIAGSNGGQDYFLAPPDTASKLVIDGSMGDYVITRVDESSFDAHNTALQGRSASLYDGVAFYEVSRWTLGGSVVFVQADSVEFTDGVVRLTSDGVIGTSLPTGIEVLHGGTGDDRLSAGAGDDMLFGFDGNDVLLGNDGNDTLVSIGGEDTLIGGAGNDTLVVYGGTSSGNGSTADLYGGEGNDVFVIAPEYGFTRDITIHDFVIGEDKLDLSRLRKDEGGLRELTGEDLDLESLTAMLQDDGSLSIDLSQFCTDNGSSMGGTLTLKLAGGSSELSLSDIIIDPIDATPIDTLYVQAFQLVP